MVPEWICWSNCPRKLHYIQNQSVTISSPEVERAFRITHNLMAGQGSQECLVQFLHCKDIKTESEKQVSPNWDFLIPSLEASCSLLRQSRSSWVNVYVYIPALSLKIAGDICTWESSLIQPPLPDSPYPAHSNSDIERTKSLAKGEHSLTDGHNWACSVASRTGGFLFTARIPARGTCCVIFQERMLIALKLKTH